jgi:hypothetical protein
VNARNNERFEIKIWFKERSTWCAWNLVIMGRVSRPRETKDVRRSGWLIWRLLFWKAFSTGRIEFKTERWLHLVKDALLDHTWSTWWYLAAQLETQTRILFSPKQFLSTISRLGLKHLVVLFTLTLKTALLSLFTTLENHKRSRQRCKTFRLSSASWWHRWPWWTRSSKKHSPSHDRFGANCVEML